MTDCLIRVFKMPEGKGNVDLIMLRNGADINICEKGRQISKVLDTRSSSFTIVKRSKQTKSERNWNQPDNYFSFYPRQQCSSNKSKKINK